MICECLVDLPAVDKSTFFSLNTVTGLVLVAVVVIEIRTTYLFYSLSICICVFICVHYTLLFWLPCKQ